MLAGPRRESLEALAPDPVLEARPFGPDLRVDRGWCVRTDEPMNETDEEGEDTG